MNKKDHSQTIARRIIELSEEHHITLNNLAKKSNIRQSTLNSIINDGNVPTISTISALCDGLNISLSEFFNIPKYNKKTVS